MGHGFLPIIGLLVLVGIVLLVVWALASSRGKHRDVLPYEKTSALFSSAERSFLGVLEQALDAQHRVMGKVRLADVISVRKGLEGSARQAAFNGIQSKHLDFVVCDTKDLSIQYVVELDDQSHDRAKRQGRDEFVDKALQAAGIPIFHFSAKSSYVVAEVQKVLAARGSPPDRDPRPPAGERKKA